MDPVNLLDGQVAIITGGVGAVGLATARLFLKHGARVVLVDIHPASEAESQLRELGTKIHYEQCDVTEETEVARVWDKAFALENRLDIVFNNAAVPGPLGKPLDELPMEDFHNCLRVNLGGMVVGTKHAARLMKPAKKGSIVCTSSLAGVVAGLGAFVYSISKAAVIAMVQNAAGELGPHGIRVNAVSPGGMATPLLASMLSAMSGFQREWTVDDVEESLRKTSRLPPKTLEVSDVANAVLYLVSDLGRFVNGQNLSVDGGHSTSRPSALSSV